MESNARGMADEEARSRFAVEAAALVVFGGLAVALLGPTIVGNWVATGAVGGGIYWTLLYHERFETVQDRIPGSDRATMLLGFLIVVVFLEFGGNPDVTGSLVLGFVVGVVVSGLAGIAGVAVDERLQRE